MHSALTLFVAAITSIAPLFHASVSVYAQPQPVSVENSFFEFFNKTCLLNMPRLDKVRAVARLHDWKPITGDAAALLAPSDPRAPFEGWVAPHDGRAVLVGLSEGVLESKKVVICTAIERKLDQDMLVDIIQTNIKRRVTNDETENMQRYRAWLGTTNGQQIMLHLTTSAKDRTSAATLAVFAQALK